ncbi:receptor activity-modifying protein 1-like [Genypterus blacodes]|uniref:receptor activity-modifying protein 1-like n=1 Tax=Genypterus blacodes TaxID=154954 RepID=UPI003F76E18F
MEKQVTWVAYLLGLTCLCTGLAHRNPVPSCDQHMFDSHVHNLCLPDFNKSMEANGYLDRCPWPTVKCFYDKLKHCVDDWAMASFCKGTGFQLDEIFLQVHETYFSLCGLITDPPLITLIAIISPCIIFTLLLPALCVYLTTWNTEMPSSLGL